MLNSSPSRGEKEFQLIDALTEENYIHVDFLT